MSSHSDLLLLLMCAAALSGCAKHTSTIIPLTIGQGVLENTNGDDDDCGWIHVDERNRSRTSLVDGVDRPFHDALFYCCPGPDGKGPVCREANWQWQYSDANE